uniref:LRRCT domain-containing protein n=1 Tax=Strigamia maritima TaxID=126957 RepID=T1JHL4_STRMM
MLWQISDYDFSHLASLQILNLKNNKLETVPDLHSLTNLTMLYLNFNNITHIDQNSFTGLNALTDLSLEGNKINILVNGTFMHSPHLKFISLASNGIYHIDDETFNNLKNLQSLVISNNKIHEMKQLFTPALDILNISNNSITVFEFTSISKNLRRLYLDDNKIQVVRDPKGIQNNYSLRLFSATGNCLQTFSVHYYPPTIQDISLAHNNISKISKFSVIQPAELFSVDLTNNSISEILYQDIIYMAPVLSTKQLVAIIDLRSNPLLCSCTNDWLGKGTKMFLWYIQE